MGNSSSKDHRPSSRHEGRHASSQQPPHTVAHLSPQDQQRLANHIYGDPRSEGRRTSQQNLSLFHIGSRDRDGELATPERPRETKPEREARRAERDRQSRLRERERSIREEGVDGGYLVTLGTYTGTEDFSKPIVRQLQIERRLAPFWRGLNDHSSEWTEAQLVAVARGLPLPAPDEVPPELDRQASQTSSHQQASETYIGGFAIPITSRSLSHQSDTSANLSASHPAFAMSGTASPTAPPLFRGRSKTLASLASGTKSQSPDLTPQEIQLPKDSHVNGTPMEAVLYKDAAECPICFLSYPPYINRTRCCSQDICSECFVQIKRPDPHPPEHEQPGHPRPPEEVAETLVSEVASCPFCKTPEFGVTYDPPPFRRGLAYVNQNSLRSPTSAMSSSSSLTSGPGRRRATSLSANAPNVITTDRVRPDWAKKLSDARANALRRSAAATALHNAAYMLGGVEGGHRIGGLRLSRRRTLFTESPGASGTATPREGDSGSDLFLGRTSSRRPRVEDIEELMMNEAIRLSLVAEEERKRKEEKEAAKEAKKKAKEAKKEEKKAEKRAKRNGSVGSLYHIGSNESSSTWGSQSMGRSTSNLGHANGAPPPQQPSIPEEHAQSTGKGKQPAQESSADVSSGPSSAIDNPQRHLTASRANLQPQASTPIPLPTTISSLHGRQLSTGSSAASSFIDSASGSLRADSNLPSNSGSGLDVSSNFLLNHQQRSGTPPTTANATTTSSGASNLEPMFNFRSLAAMIDNDERLQDFGDGEKSGNDAMHIENAISPAQQQNHQQQTTDDFLAAEEFKEPSPTSSPRMMAAGQIATRSRGDSGESFASSSALSSPPPIYVDARQGGEDDAIGDATTPVSHESHVVSSNADRKALGDVRVLHNANAHEATQ